MKGIKLHQPFIFSCLLVWVLSSGFPLKLAGQTDTSLAQDTCLANSLLIEAEWRVESGNFQLAIALQEEAIALYQKHQQWERVIQTLIELAQLSDNIDYEIKALYADQAVDLAERHLDDRHVLRASAYQQKAEVYAAFEKLDSSLLYYGLAIPVFVQAEKWEDAAYGKIQEAINYYYQGNMAAATAKLDEEFWTEHQLSNEVLSVLYNLQGVFAYQVGDFNQAIAITQKALELDLLKAELTTTDSFYIADYLNNLGVFYNVKGDSQRSLDHFIRAIDIYQQLPDDFEQELQMNLNIAKVLISQTAYEASIPYFKKCETAILAQANPSDYTDMLEECYNQTGVAYKKIGEYEQALYYASKAIALPGSQGKAKSLMTIGSTYLLQHKPEMATEVLQQALQQVDQLGHEGQETKNYQSRINYFLGEVAAQQKNHELAIFHYQQTLFLYQEDTIAQDDLYTNPSLNVTDNHIFFLDALQAKARSLGQLFGTGKDLEASLETYLLCIDWTDSLRQDFILEDNELFWSQRYQEIYEGAIHATYRLFQLKNDNSYLELAFSLSEKSKAKLLLEAFKTNTNQANGGVPAELTQQERDLGIDVAFYEKSLAQAISDQDSSKINLYQNYLATTRLDLTQLKEDIQRDYPAFHTLKYADLQLDLDQLRASLLDDQSALLEYFTGAKNSYLFVFTQEHLDIILLPHSTSIDATVRALQAQLLYPEKAQISAKNAFAAFNYAAYQLYVEILEEAIGTLPAPVQQLIIIPDGPLNLLSFDVLNTQLAETSSSNFAQLPYLINRYQMQYAYSAKVLLENQNRQDQLTANTQCLAFAPPYQNTAIFAQQVRSAVSRDNGVAMLEGTAQEIESISQYFKGYFESGTDATKKVFLENAADYGILHLAMHGQADFENTKFGHLIFTNKNMDEEEETLLYHYEIANLPLQAQLVVLSACETGLGKYEAGEGVFSLARSFMYAGVPSVIMSLWKVNDLSTSQLMPDFYQLLAKGMDKGKALHQAKLHFLEEASLIHSHPFYWSGFVSMGDTQPLKEPSSILKYLLATALLVALVVAGYRLFPKQ